MTVTVICWSFGYCVSVHAQLSYFGRGEISLKSGLNFKHYLCNSFHIQSEGSTNLSRQVLQDMPKVRLMVANCVMAYSQQMNTF